VDLPEGEVTSASRNFSRAISSCDRPFEGKRFPRRDEETQLRRTGAATVRKRTGAMARSAIVLRPDGFGKTWACRVISVMSRVTGKTTRDAGP